MVKIPVLISKESEGVSRSNSSKVTSPSNQPEVFFIAAKATVPKSDESPFGPGGPTGPRSPFKPGWPSLPGIPWGPFGPDDPGDPVVPGTP